jgi:pimeloyl-ACP methyl ester carboxylesterase
VAPGRLADVCDTCRIARLVVATVTVGTGNGLLWFMHLWWENTPLMATFVLVHGGFCRRWVWGDTATALADRGHSVQAVDLPTSGTDPRSRELQDDVDTVRQALDASGSGAVLVGHSASGMVLAELANHPAVQHSVHVAALRPERGQSVADMLGGQIPGWMVVRPEEGLVTVSDSPAVVRQALCADVEEDRFLRDVYPRG